MIHKKVIILNDNLRCYRKLYFFHFIAHTNSIEMKSYADISLYFLYPLFNLTSNTFDRNEPPNNLQIVSHISGKAATVAILEFTKYNIG